MQGSWCTFRCHPAISTIPNQHFYQGRLLDGCLAGQRAALVPGLAPLSFQDVRGHEARSGHSLSNAAEASAVQRLVQRLAAQGLEPGRMGVICFFRAQVLAAACWGLHGGMLGLPVFGAARCMAG